MKKELKREYWLIGTGVFLIILSIISLRFFSQTIGTLLLIFGIIIGVIPNAISNYFKYQRLQKMEEHFPRFLRDFAESKKSGMTFSQALINVRNTDYGALSEEIKKSANQISWDIPFPKVMKNLSKRIKQSKLMKQSFMIIDEAYKSGGDIATTMDSLAMDMGIIKNMRDEQKSIMSQQVVLIYLIFFMFLGIVIMLHNMLIPMMSIGNQQGDLFGSEISLSFQQNNCDIVPFLCSFCPIFGFEGMDQSCYFKILFLFMAIVQGTFSGMIAGQIVAGSPSAGVKHSLIMVISAVIIFLIFVS